MFTPAPVETYQFAGVAGSIATIPPSPAASCGHAAAGRRAQVAAVPFAPSPTSSVLASLGSWAKLTTSASDPSPPFRFSKCVASLAAHGAALLVHAIQRPPQPAIVAHIHQRQPACPRARQRRNRVLRRRHHRRRAQPFVRIRRIANSTQPALRKRAAIQIHRPRKHQRVRPRRHRRQRQVIVPLRNRRAPAAHLQRRRRQPRPKARRRRRAARPRPARTHPAISPGRDCSMSTVNANVSPLTGCTASAPRKIGQLVLPATYGFVGHAAVRQPRPRLRRQPRPRHPIGRLVVPMEAHRRIKHLPHRIPHHRRRRIAAAARARQRLAAPSGCHPRSSPSATSRPRRSSSTAPSRCSSGSARSRSRPPPPATAPPPPAPASSCSTQTPQRPARQNE